MFPICAALVVCVAVSASAQDAQPDPLEKMVRDVESARAQQIDRALGAPAKAFEPLERKSPYDRPPDHVRPSTSFPWIPAACVAVAAAVVVAFVARAVWRWAGDERSRR